jgi:ABC-type sugar transport system permease subunit
VKFKHIIKGIGANLLAGIIGIIFSVPGSIYIGVHFWLPKQLEDVSSGLELLVGVLVFSVVTVIIFGILGIIFGLIIGILIYQIIKRRKLLKRKKHSKKR